MAKSMNSSSDCEAKMSKKKQRRKKKRMYDDDDDDDDLVDVSSEYQHQTDHVTNGRKEEREEEPKWPTHFLALRITDPDVLRNLIKVQDHIISKDPSLQTCRMPAEALHITLCNLGLETPQQVEQAVDFLLKSQAEIAASLPKESLRIEGVSHFDNQILYARVEPRELVLEFVERLNDLVKKAGLEIRDGTRRKYTPHATILKVSYPVARQRCSWTVKPMYYADFTDIPFGEQQIDTIFLCSMGGKRRHDGFYVTHAEIHFQPFHDEAQCLAHDFM